MKIGLYFGSFNPIHIGHLIIANYILNATDLEKIWLVLSPQNPLKPSNSLLNEYDRLHLAHLATENDSRLKVSDIEFGLPRPSYTSTTMAYISEKYPEHDFAIIMGGDSFKNIEKWKNHETILKNYLIYVYQRPGHEIAIDENEKVQILKNTPLLQISSTEIRELIKSGKSIRYMLPELVKEEIEKSGYYKK